METTTSVSLTDIQLIDCAAEQHGGALALSGTGAVDVDELWVAQSEASLDGGAVAIDLSDGLEVTLDTVDPENRDLYVKLNQRLREEVKTQLVVSIEVN